MLFRQVSNGDQPTLPLDTDRITFVAALLGDSGPTAVARFVVATWIDTIYGMRWCRFRPHVGEKISEPVFAAPAVADNDPASAVVSKAAVVAVVAASHHP